MFLCCEWLCKGWCVYGCVLAAVSVKIGEKVSGCEFLVYLCALCLCGVCVLETIWVSATQTICISNLAVAPQYDNTLNTHMVRAGVGQRPSGTAVSQAAIHNGPNSNQPTATNTPTWTLSLPQIWRNESRDCRSWIETGAPIEHPQIHMETEKRRELQTRIKATPKNPYWKCDIYLICSIVLGRFFMWSQKKCIK